jgi:Protein of unknown function (DUF1588)/Protein of unknown function (DUF1592)/Protein of unknown function (DUF1595)
MRAFVLSGLALAGCVGELGGTADVVSTTCRASAFSCNAASTQPSSLPRLSRAEYKTALERVVRTIANESADTVWAVAANAMASVPADVVTTRTPGLFASMDQNVLDAHVSRWFYVAAMVGQKVGENADSILGCSGDTNACIDAFILRLAKEAFRHTPREDELQFLRSVYAADEVDAQAVADVVTVALSAPQFLYRLELGGGPSETPNSFRLTPAELATKLSLFLWREPPDEALLAQTESVDIGDDTAFGELVDSMLDDSRADAFYRAFAEQWLAPSWAGDLDRLVDSPAFQAFAGEDLPSPDLQSDMLAELGDSLAYHTRHGGSLEDWFLSPYSFARTEELARIYGVPVWDGRSEPPRFNDPERVGVLTRAAILSNSSGATRPVMKGVFIRERILCQEVGAPPPIDPSVLTQISTPSATASTRDVVTALTGSGGCVACHQNLNPLGFATENFDALGRRQTSQRLFAQDGTQTGTAAVDTRSQVMLCSGSIAEVSGARELAETIARGTPLSACFATQYTRFMLGRKEVESTDGCVMESIRSALESGDLRSAIRSSLMSPTYRLHSLEG